MVETLPWWRWALLAVFFGGLAIAWWWVKRGEIRQLLSGKKPGTRLKILERRYLGPKSCVMLIEADRQTFLLAQTGTGVAWQPLEKSRPPFKK